MKIKKIGRGLVGVIIAIALGFLFLGKDSIINLYASRCDIKRKEREIVSLHLEIDSLTIEIKRLKNDTAYIEKIAREKLGMAGKNEKVFKFVEEK
jgi:cell division protein FtsB